MVQWPHKVKYCICCSARVTIQRVSVVSLEACFCITNRVLNYCVEMREQPHPFFLARQTVFRVSNFEWCGQVIGFLMLSTTRYHWISHWINHRLPILYFRKSQGTYAVLLALSHSKYRTRSKGCSFRTDGTPFWIRDTHKGESDLSTRQFGISNRNSSQIEHWTC